MGAAEAAAVDRAAAFLLAVHSHRRGMLRLSVVGTHRVPGGRSREDAVNPPDSHQSALMRSRRRFTNRNSWPSSTFFLNSASTIPQNAPSTARVKLLVAMKSRCGYFAASWSS